MLSLNKWEIIFLENNPYHLFKNLRISPVMTNITITDLPELGTIINVNICDQVEFLKESFHSVLTCDKKKMEKVLDAILCKFKNMGEYFLKFL